MSFNFPRLARSVLPLIMGGVLFNLTVRADQALVRALAESNVNQQYVIESVSISGVEVARFHDSKLSPSLRRRLTSLVGMPCDMSAIGDLAGRLRSTLHLQDVHQRLLRGSSPDRVRVDFEAVQKDYAFDLSVPRFLYDSNQGWTTEVNANARARTQSISVGLGSNGDDLTERYTGFSARYENSHVFSDRIRFAVGFEDYHDIWNPATRLAVSDQTSSNETASNTFALYRARRNIAPALTFALSRALSVSIGASFERMEMEAPSQTGSGDMSANAATAEVDFGYTMEDGDAVERWDGVYGLRAATHDLGSDYVYLRQNISLRYEWKSGRHLIVERLMAGALTGQAPLFERFVLGNSSTLQGFSHYAIDPLGGNRMAHDSVSYGYQLPQGTPEIFYDAGIIGNGDRLGTLRHSLGIGFRQGIFNVATAFPLCQGRFAAVFMAGMNY
jgi:outer membrane protein assembly factor BamA